MHKYIVRVTPPLIDETRGDNGGGGIGDVEMTAASNTSNKRSRGTANVARVVSTSSQMTVPLTSSNHSSGGPVASTTATIV